MKRYILIVLLAACGGQSGGGDDRKRDDCERLRDHAIDLRLESTPRPKTMSDEEVGRHRAALLAAAGDRFIADCRAQRSDEELACALAASNPDALRACLPQPENR